MNEYLCELTHFPISVKDLWSLPMGDFSHKYQAKKMGDLMGEKALAILKK